MSDTVVPPDSIPLDRRVNLLGARVDKVAHDIGALGIKVRHLEERQDKRYDDLGEKFAKLHEYVGNAVGSLVERHVELTQAVSHLGIAVGELAAVHKAKKKKARKR